MPPRRRVSRPAGADSATPLAPTEEKNDLSLSLSFDNAEESESAAAGAPSPDADSAVGDLFSILLRWDFDALVARGGAAEVEGSDDPSERVQLKSLPLTFKDANEYVSAFKPLMLEELGSQLLRGCGGRGEAGGLSGSASVVEVREADDASAPLSSSRFTLATLSLPRDADASALFADNDAVLVTVGAMKKGEPCFSALAVVDARSAAAAPPEQTFVSGKRKQASASLSSSSSSTRGLLRLRLCLSGGGEEGGGGGRGGGGGGSERQRERLRGVADALQAASADPSISSEIGLLRLANLSTIAREWAALHAAAVSPLAPLLFDPTSPESLALVLVSSSSPSSAPPASAAAVKEETGGGNCNDMQQQQGQQQQPSPLSGLPAPLRAALEAEFNPSQLLAAAAGISSPSSSSAGAPRLALIQGPPGTGKTRTLLALLSVLLHGGGGGGEFPPNAPSTPAQQPGPSAPLSPGDAARLWRRAAPWWAGAADPRDEALERSSGGGAERRGCGGGEGGVENEKLSPPPPPPRPSPPIRVRLGRGAPPRVLVCAPSNAALDEIVARLLSPGLLDASGRRFAPSVVRLGLRASAQARAASLDSLVDARLRSAASGGSAGNGRGGDEAGGGGTGGWGKRARDRARAEVLASAQVVCATLSFAGSASLLGPLSGEGGGGEVAAAAGEEEEEEEDEEGAAALGRLQQQQQQRRRGAAFAAVVVDEAAQAVEPSTLIALARCCSGFNGGLALSSGAAVASKAGGKGEAKKGNKNPPPSSPPSASASLFGCARAFLVGDPAQLPATVLSARAARAGYERSLFARLAAAGRAAEKGAKRRRAAEAAAGAAEAEEGVEEEKAEAHPLLPPPSSAVPLLVLDTQYRMHPAISAFPRAAFYGGGLSGGNSNSNNSNSNEAQPPALLLRDAPGVRAATTRGWHAHACFGPLAVFDVRGAEARAGGGGGNGGSGGGGTSLENRAEAAAVLALYRALARRYPAARARGTVGVVTPYRAQAALLRARLDAAMLHSQQSQVPSTAAGGNGGVNGDASSLPSSSRSRAPLSTASALSPVEVGTVDGFQGREKDVVIVSAVRSSVGIGGGRDGSNGDGDGDGEGGRSRSSGPRSLLGFVADERRANVALTRARSSLLVVCNAPALAAGDETWRRLIEHARSRGCLFRAEPPFSAFVDGVVAGRIGPVPPRQVQVQQQPMAVPRQQQGQQQEQQQQQQQRRRGGGDWKAAAASAAAARNAGVVLDADDDLSDDAPEPVGVGGASTRRLHGGGGGAEEAATAAVVAHANAAAPAAAAPDNVDSAQRPKRARRGAK